MGWLNLNGTFCAEISDIEAYVKTKLMPVRCPVCREPRTVRELTHHPIVQGEDIAYWLHRDKCGAHIQIFND
jgi:hypothetical protein